MRGRAQNLVEMGGGHIACPRTHSNALPAPKADSMAAKPVCPGIRQREIAFESVRPSKRLWRRGAY